MVVIEKEIWSWISISTWCMAGGNLFARSVKKNIQNSTIKTTKINSMKNNGNGEDISVDIKLKDWRGVSNILRKAIRGGYDTGYSDAIDEIYEVLDKCETKDELRESLERMKQWIRRRW